MCQDKRDQVCVNRVKMFVMVKVTKCVAESNAPSVCQSKRD